jgi:hypothetical protein
METTLTKKYYWRDLTSDGLLREPDETGPYYSRESLNNCGCGFDTEEQAFAALSRWRGYGSFVLITEYSTAL